MNDVIIFGIGIIVALITAILGPCVIEYYKWRNEPKRKVLHEGEVRYFSMLKNASGFFEPPDPNKIDEFYEHYRAAWLYVPDQVIKSINRFYETYIGVQEKGEKEEAMSNMILEMRRAFYGNTDLTLKDFLFIKAKRVKLKEGEERGG